MKNQNENRNKILSSVYTFCITALILLVTFAFGIYTPNPPIPEGVVAISIGELDAGRFDEPFSSLANQPEPVKVEPVVADELAVTQNTEDVSVSLKEDDKKEPKPLEPPNKVVKPTTTTPKETPKPTADSRFSGATFGDHNSNRGNNNADGNQGDPNGNPNGDPLGYSYGKVGNGGDYKIQGKGRKLERNSSIKCDFDEEQDVYFIITVDKNGYVTGQTVDLKKTKSTSEKNIECAKRILKTLKFSPSEIENGKGEIKINFQRN